MIALALRHNISTLVVKFGFSVAGDPPQAAAWLGQCGTYLLIMVLEKGAISLVLLVPGWSKVCACPHTV